MFRRKRHNKNNRRFSKRNKLDGRDFYKYEKTIKDNVNKRDKYCFKCLKTKGKCE